MIIIIIIIIIIIVIVNKKQINDLNKGICVLIQG